MPNKPSTWRESGLSWIGLSLAVILLDQITKRVVLASFDLYERIAVLPIFNLTYVRNPGAAFSFLSDAGGWQRWFFTAIALGVTGLLLYWLRETPKKHFTLNGAYTLIIGGAIGNLIDRLEIGRAHV